MDDDQCLVARVREEQGDILGTLQLVDGDAHLQDRLFHQLVDLLLEGMFLELRAAYIAGGLDHRRYVAEVDDLADRCTSSGLLPLPSRRR